VSQFYGSLNNRFDERVLQPIPVKGMGATLLMWSDRHAYTILDVCPDTIEATISYQDGKEIKSITRKYPKWILACRDEVKVVEGSCHDGSAKYEYKTRKEGEPGFSRELFVYHKPTNIYRQSSTTWNPRLLRYDPIPRCKRENTALALGYRDEYYDPSF
jgi:hypothetical protein